MIKLIKIFSFLFFLGAGSFLLFQSDKAQKKLKTGWESMSYLHQT